MYRGVGVSEYRGGAELRRENTNAEIAFPHNYVAGKVFNKLDQACDTILAQIVTMIVTLTGG
jgi:hypothetical protein